jgi:hypothetical protein
MVHHSQPKPGGVSLNRGLDLQESGLDLADCQKSIDLEHVLINTYFGTVFVCAYWMFTGLNHPIIDYRM